MSGAPKRIPSQFAGGRPIEAVGLRRRPARDAYHFLLTISWPRLFLLVVGTYLGANALFALGYLLEGDVIENARRGDFWDAFFFSVQTMATIGYGKMAPRTLAANALVAAEALIGMLGLAVVTGLTFAKFSRPTARVLFSRVAVVGPYDGVPSLLLRMANERTNQIVEAQLRVTLVRNETTAEGETVRRTHDLRLRRAQSAMFALTWTAIHPITPDSPLHGATPASMAASESDLVVSLTGWDDSLAQTIHARHAYRSDQVLFGVRFQDVISRLPDGTRRIDYGRFHGVEPLDPAAPAAAAAREPV